MAGEWLDTLRYASVLEDQALIIRMADELDAMTRLMAGEQYNQPKENKLQEPKLFDSVKFDSELQAQADAFKALAEGMDSMITSLDKQSGYIYGKAPEGILARQKLVETVMQFNRAVRDVQIFKNSKNSQER